MILSLLCDTIGCILLAWLNGATRRVEWLFRIFARCIIRPAQATRNRHHKEQEDPYRDRGISDVKDSEAVANFRNAKEDEVNNIAPVHGPVDQVPDRSADNHAKDDFIG